MVAFVKRFLLLLLLALLLVPVVQSRLHFSKEAGLAGAFTEAPHPDLTWDGLRNSTYQPALESYVEDRIGFRPYLIRLRNQLSFSLFRVARSSDIVVGQHEVLFQPGPIASYAGRDLLDSATVRMRVRHLRLVQRALARRGVQLLFVLAPNKARFEPEMVPDHLLPAPGARTNYDLYLRALQADTVALLDFVPLFARWKTQYPYPLFPRGGTHWSGYGATLAADTLVRRLEQLGGVHLPTVRVVGPPHVVHTTDSLRVTDNDIGWPLNLMWQRETTPMAYRRLVFDSPKPGQVRPSALFVGDSFMWGMMQFAPYIQREFADDTRYWYYNNVVYQPDTIAHATGQKATDLDLRQQVESRRFVVVLLTEHNLPDAEFGFTDQLYRLYYPALAQAQQAAIAQLAQKLTAEAPWEEQTKEDFAQRINVQAQAQYERQLLQ